MKKFELDNVLNQKRLTTHIGIFLFSVILMLVNRYIASEESSLESYMSVMILIFSQIEVFIFISHMIFSDLVPGVTPGEITRTLLSRFAFFLIACLAAAFFIFIGFLCITRLLSGLELSTVLSDFFKYSFSGWFKSTFGGLAFGTVIFIVILWQDALRREQKLREENLIFQNETLRNQVNPHFLFNSLNTLSSLIETQPETSGIFISRLASIYRYILDNSQKDKVPLAA
jgi:sensor histidine kinase YesM